MARLIGPDEASRTVFLTSGANKGKAAAQGMSVPLYADQALTTAADVRSTTDQVIAGTPPTLTVDAYSQIPLFKYPDDVDVVYTSINGGPAVPLYARTDERIDGVTARVTALEPGGGSAALAAGSNLSDVPNKATARTSLGLGTSATKNVGTGSADVAAGDAPAAAQTAAVGAAAALAIVFGA